MRYRANTAVSYRVRSFAIRVCLVVTALIVFASGDTQVSSPGDRRPTDPRSVVSAAKPGARPVPIGDLYFTRTVSDASWSPDGKEIAFTTDITGRLNLWKVSAAGGWPVQLVQSEDGQTRSVWSPDGKWLVFCQDVGGNETHDLYAVPSSGGQVINLTNTPSIREYQPRFSPAGKRLMFVYRPTTSPATDIALMDWDTKKVRKLTNEETKDHIWLPIGWSPDGKTVYANRARAAAVDGNVYSIEVATGKAENLTPHAGNVFIFASAVSPDGRSILLTSPEKGGYKNVALLDVASKRLTWVTDTKWEATAHDFSPDSEQFTYSLNADGRTDLYLASRKGGAPQKIGMPEGLNSFRASPSSFSPKGDKLLVRHESSTEPAEYWIYNLVTKRVEQLTKSAVGSLNPDLIPRSEIVHYKSFDGKIISAFLWMPFNLKRDGTNPALVLPHGGPTAQLSDYWNTDVVALTSRGYICIAPNVRGSTGYGTEFQMANYQDFGGGDLQDEVYAVEFLKATGYVDPKKIGITGGSYGGFMTLMAIGKTPDIWAAAVEQYGIIDWLAMAQNADRGLQEYLKKMLGDPVADRRVYEAASPLSYLKNARTPLLVLQGENDVRVPRDQAQKVVDALKATGGIVEAHFYPDEGHGFDKRENQIDAINRIVGWFDRYLKKTPGKE